MIFHEFYKYTENTTVSTIAMLIAITLTWQMTPRPFLFSPLFFLYFHSYMLRNNPKWHDWIFAPLLMCLWANIHGAFVIVVTVFIVSIFLHFLKKKYDRKTCHSSNWVLIAIICVLSSFINPHPVQLVDRIITAGSYPTLDWKPITWWLVNMPVSIMPIIIIYIFVLYVFVISYFRNKHASSIYYSSYFICALFCIMLPVQHIRLSWLLLFPIISSAYVLHKNDVIKNIIQPESDFRFIPYLRLFFLFIIVNVFLKLKLILHFHQYQYTFLIKKLARAIFILLGIGVVLLYGKQIKKGKFLLIPV